MCDDFDDWSGCEDFDAGAELPDDGDCEEEVGDYELPGEGDCNAEVIATTDNSLDAGDVFVLGGMIVGQVYEEGLGGEFLRRKKR